MTRLALFAIAVVALACSRPPRWLGGGPDPSTAHDTLYWSALHYINPANPKRSLDTGIAKLDAYLASAEPLRHSGEAAILRRLAEEAQQLAKLDSALQALSTPAETKVAEKPRDDESLKEIQRLKDELAKANAELERIRKRLATPPKP